MKHGWSNLSLYGQAKGPRLQGDLYVFTRSIKSQIFPDCSVSTLVDGVLSDADDYVKTSIQYR